MLEALHAPKMTDVYHDKFSNIKKLTQKLMVQKRHLL